MEDGSSEHHLKLWFEDILETTSFPYTTQFKFWYRIGIKIMMF